MTLRHVTPAFIIAFALAAFGETLPKPDITVAADGTGDFKTIQSAVTSILATNHERIIIFIKNGVYHEKIRVDASFVTLRGESRHGTRIEFSQLNDDFNGGPDKIGRAVINLNHADDFVLENLTAENTADQIGPHAFTIYGTGDRTVLLDCDVLSHGADTVSLWLGDRGRYYHSGCKFQGSVDCVCPRGWCYLTNCEFYEMKDTAAVWHDGSRDPDMKFVLRDCKFDGAPGWNLGRHHADAQFYFLDCSFSKTMTNKPIRRVVYPLGGGPATGADQQRNKEYDKKNLWGERSYFYDCHRDGGDFAWFADNLSSATNSLKPAQITAAWTFVGKWNPEDQAGPKIQSVKAAPGNISVTFSEPVTVKGHPQLRISNGKTASYASGSGTPRLYFSFSPEESSEATSIDLNEGAIIGCEASAHTRLANISLPAK